MTPHNLLFILSDQHNRDTLGCYGHPLVQTPHLDGLAARGARFANAYTNCPICVPERASLATGRYVHRIGYWDNAFPYEGRIPSWGHRLIDQGHVCTSIGKLHYRSEDDNVGFTETRIPLNVVDGIGDVLGAIRDDIPVRAGSRPGVLNAGPGDSTYLRYDADIAAEATRWLRETAPTLAAPWMLFVSFVCPHPPFIAPQELFDLYPPEQIPIPVQNRPEEQPPHPALETIRQTMEYAEPFDDATIKRVTAAYYGACTWLDRQIGKVLEGLSQTGREGDTRIIYTTDHGESMGRRGLWGKFTMYEEAAAVPFLMAGPDVPAGRVVEEAVTLVDCFPTILEAIGARPEAEDGDLPGQSLWPLAMGTREDMRERPVFSEYHAVASRSASFMVREGRYKLIYYVGFPSQLFDLESDPQELRDLASEPAHAATVERLTARLHEILAPETPEEVDARAKRDQQLVIERHGGEEAVRARGTFTNSPAPGETPKFHSQPAD